MAEKSIFTKIIEGEIPAHKIYEDEHTFAFLDIHPIQSGHTLVVPKQPIEFVWDLPDELYHAVMKTVKKVAERQREILNPGFVGVKIMGVDVPHAHVHVIPFDTMAEFRKVVDMSAEPNHSSLTEIAKKLAF